MNNEYLQQLLDEVKNRDGGVMLNVAGKTEAVVLTLDRYNQLLVAKQQPHNQIINSAVLVIGGAGYIGAHVVRKLIAGGHTVTVFDNLSTGKASNIHAKATFVKGDLLNAELIKQILKEQSIEVVIHLAASIEVAESVEKPMEYFKNNVEGTAGLLKAMSECGVRSIIFSSTAAVYGEPEIVPIKEDSNLKPNNPYGATKLLCEDLISYYANYNGLKAVIFRYFNACGSDFDKTIKSSHNTHLVPIVMDVVAGKKESLTIYGKDYDTFDGTCIRDYVHVLDIAEAHLRTIKNLSNLDQLSIFNIGTSKGYSVEQVVQAAAEVTGKMIPIEIHPRRAGDAAITVADNTKIKEILNFELQFSDLETIIRTSMNSDY